MVSIDIRSIGLRVDKTNLDARMVLCLASIFWQVEQLCTYWRTSSRICDQLNTSAGIFPLVLGSETMHIRYFYHVVSPNVRCTPVMMLRIFEVTDDGHTTTFS